jgi:hypothetical protein
MARSVAIGFPIGGLTAAFLGLLLWVSSLPLAALDGLVLGVFVCGLALSGVAVAYGRDAATRQLGVVGIGCNGFGALLVAVLYTAG